MMGSSGEHDFEARTENVYVHPFAGPGSRAAIHPTPSFGPMYTDPRLKRP